MTDYLYFKIRAHPGGGWIDRWDTRTLDPNKIYKIVYCNECPLNVIFLTKVEVLIAIGKGTEVEELTD